MLRVMRRGCGIAGGLASHGGGAATGKKAQTGRSETEMTWEGSERQERGAACKDMPHLGPGGNEGARWKGVLAQTW